VAILLAFEVTCPITVIFLHCIKLLVTFWETWIVFYARYIEQMLVDEYPAQH